MATFESNLTFGREKIEQAALLGYGLLGVTNGARIQDQFLIDPNHMGVFHQPPAVFAREVARLPWTPNHILNKKMDKRM